MQQIRTLLHFQQVQIAMLAEERRKQLLETVRVKRFASLPDLVERLGASESTIRRDLDNLEERGVIRRIHGGVLYAGGSPKMPHFDARQPIQIEVKKAIAAEAVRLIEDGDTVLLDGGSTTYEVAQLLVGRPVHVVTTSLPMANLFAPDSGCDLVFVGGNICPRTGVAQGPYAEKMLDMVRVRKTVISVAGIKEDGFFNNNLMLVETEQAMMRAADETIVVADSSKFGHQSLAHVCELQEIDCLITDSGIPSEWRKKLTEAGIHLIVASENDKDEANNK